MMKAFKVVAVLLLVTISFVAGAVTYALNQPRVMSVTVELRNNSGKDIAEIELKEGHGTALKLPGLPSAQSTITAFYYPGETSYSLRVAFTDGRVLEGGGNYVEP